MQSSTALVATDRPERYIKQLMSHFAHKADASVGEDGVGVANLAGGRCVLTPENGQLRMQASAEDAETLARVEGVIGSHLVRFAGDNEPLSVEWSPDLDASARPTEAAADNDDPDDDNSDDGNSDDGNSDDGNSDDGKGNGATDGDDADGERDAGTADEGADEPRPDPSRQT